MYYLTSFAPHTTVTSRRPQSCNTGTRGALRFALALALGMKHSEPNTPRVAVGHQRSQSAVKRAEATADRAFFSQLRQRFGNAASSQAKHLLVVNACDAFLGLPPPPPELASAVSSSLSSSGSAKGAITAWDMLHDFFSSVAGAAPLLQFVFTSTRTLGFMANLSPKVCAV